MNKLAAILLMLSFVLPVPAFAGSDVVPFAPILTYTPPESGAAVDTMKFAALDSADFIPVERKLIDEQMGKTEKKSNWWKWALGVVVVGALAAGGGGGGGGGGGASTGSTTLSW